MAFVFKTIFVWTLLSVTLLAFSTPASAQAAQANTTCNLKLNAGSFIEGTTDIKPVEGVSVTLINAQTGQPAIASQTDDHLYENVSTGEYKVSASRAGYRTTNDTITLDCAYTVQGLAEQVVAIWEGDPAKSVNYTKIDHFYGKKPIEDRPTDQPFKISAADEKDSSSQAPAKPVTGKATFAVSGRDTNLSKNTGRAAGTVSKGVVNGSALVLARPKYPPTAKAVGASGVVSVQVVLDEDGYVIAAEAVNGHPLLKGASALAAKASRFRPTLLSGTPVKVSGIIVYNFQ